MKICILQIRCNPETYLLFTLSRSYVIIAAVKCNSVVNFASVSLIYIFFKGMDSDKIKIMITGIAAELRPKEGD